MTKMSGRDLPDDYLIQLYKEDVPVIINLANKSQLSGMIIGFDLFTILIENDDGKKQLVDKNIISAIHPKKKQ